MMADRICGYPKKTAAGLALQTGTGRTISAHGHVVSRSPIRPGQRGDWISNERVSYRFEVGGAWYAGRGYGEGMSLCVRRMKRPPSRSAR